ncbi:MULTISPECIES: GNAT family N-acetyltransferase [unclassified Meiothermus]|uniref:GNAT family N-acetyltransferase n=1 Tax=unclassified Meiothermus TaxID=370471 RepID=UPI000D7CF3E1|nr:MULTISPECIES: GNAT family N-acetyltransferase [unclassified Meiothermus]PZA06722.1 GNAT family N-acetyltransferase [Meiothermus sp. Pnk-1]RYM36648.1 N-acetyltransferase [Meiothermus sp. PNK-Is4]
MDVFPCLESLRLRLREIREEDAWALYRIYTDPLVVRYHNLERLEGLEAALSFAAWMHSLYPEGRGLRWGIEGRGSPGLIGTIGYEYLDARQQGAEISYDLLPAHWGQGLMQEAVEAVLEYVRGTSLLYLEANVVSENQASARVLEKAGFIPRGEPYAQGLPGGATYRVQRYRLEVDRAPHNSSSPGQPASRSCSLRASPSTSGVQER